MHKALDELVALFLVIARRRRILTLVDHMIERFALLCDSVIWYFQPGFHYSLVLFRRKAAIMGELFIASPLPLDHALH